MQKSIIINPIAPAIAAESVADHSAREDFEKNLDALNFSPRRHTVYGRSNGRVKSMNQNDSSSQALYDGGIEGNSSSSHQTALDQYINNPEITRFYRDQDHQQDIGKVDHSSEKEDASSIATVAHKKKKEVHLEDVFGAAISSLSKMDSAFSEDQDSLVNPDLDPSLKMAAVVQLPLETGEVIDSSDLKTQTTEIPSEEIGVDDVVPQETEDQPFLVSVKKEVKAEAQTTQSVVTQDQAVTSVANTQQGSSSHLGQTVKNPAVDAMASTMRTNNLADLLNELGRSVQRVSASPNEIMVQFQSNVLADTNVVVTAKTGRIDIAFSTTEEASHLLIEANLQTLQQNLTNMSSGGQYVDIKSQLLDHLHLSSQQGEAQDQDYNQGGSSDPFSEGGPSSNSRERNQGS